MADKPLVKPGLPKHKPCPFFYYRKHVLAPVLNYRYFTGNLDVRFWRVQEIRKKRTPWPSFFLQKLSSFWEVIFHTNPLIKLSIISLFKLDVISKIGNIT